MRYDMEILMSPIIDLSSETFARLQQHAVPLVDNIETVINRLLDAYEEKRTNPEDGLSRPADEIRKFNPASPPDLKHTRVLVASLCGKQLSRSESNWNGMLNAAIREAKGQLSSLDEVQRLVIVNCVVGRKDDEGYRFLSDVGLSVQGQDANAAWKATHHILRQLRCSADIQFAWRSKEDAAFPGSSGRLIIAG